MLKLRWKQTARIPIGHLFAMLYSGTGTLCKPRSLHQQCRKNHCMFFSVCPPSCREIPFSAVQRFALRAKFLHSESPAALEFGSLACRVSFCGTNSIGYFVFAFFGEARLMSLIKIVRPYEYREIGVGDVDHPEVCVRCLLVIDKSIVKFRQGC